jgi:hypothetical protein
MQLSDLVFGNISNILAESDVPNVSTFNIHVARCASPYKFRLAGELEKLDSFSPFLQIA